MRIRFVLASALALATAQGASASINLSQFNLVASNNITGDNSDVQGRVLVGGMMSVNNFNFSSQNSNNTGQNPPAGIFNVIGSGVSSLTTNATNFIYGSGGTTGMNSFNTTYAASLNPTAVATYVGGLQDNGSGVSGYLTGLSHAYNTTPAGTNTVSYSNSNNTFALNGTTNSSGEAVFNVGASFFSTANSNISSVTINGVTLTSSNLGSAGNPTIVINVTGINGTLTQAGGAQFSGLVNLGDSANILFNFVDTTTLSGITNLGASILAPLATLNTSATLTGGVYVENVAATGEIDLAKGPGFNGPGFDGFVPSVSAVPEPATVLSTATGLALAGLFGRRRRRRRSA